MLQSVNLFLPPGRLEKSGLGPGGLGALLCSSKDDMPVIRSSVTPCGESRALLEQPLPGRRFQGWTLAPSVFSSLLKKIPVVPAAHKASWQRNHRQVHGLQLTETNAFP